MTPGHIRIKENKVYFEPKGLEKPNKTNYYSVEDDGYRCNPIFDEVGYNRVLREYEASKKLIEVSNVLPRLLPRLNEQKADTYYDVIFQDKSFEQIKNNQRCEAKIENNEAIITKIN